MADTEDTTYAPQSPDLTAADPYEPHPQHRAYRGSVSHISPFTPTSELKTPFGFPPQQLPPSAHSSYPPQPQHHHPIPQLQSPLSQPQALPHQYHLAQHHPNSSSQQQQFAPSPHLHGQQPQHYNPYFPDAPPSQQAQQYGAPSIPHAPHQHVHSPHQQQYTAHIKQEDGYGYAGSEGLVGAMPAARGGKKAKKEEDAEPENNAPGVREGIEVRTKFPVARIKRIMQADEDVGKVAQVTPVAVSKALELFMISLVTKAASQARERGSKRVLAAHLKQAVLDDDQFDYLQEIVSKVAEAPSKNADKHEDSDEAMDGGSAPPTTKKKRAAAGSGRKRKKNSDDDF